MVNIFEWPIGMYISISLEMNLGEVGKLLPTLGVRVTSYSPPTLTSVGHQWTVPTNIGLHLVVITGQIGANNALASSNWSLVSHIIKCGHVISIISSSYKHDVGCQKPLQGHYPITYQLVIANSNHQMDPNN